MGFQRLHRDFEIWLSGQPLPADKRERLSTEIASTGGDLEQIGGILIDHVRAGAVENDAIGKGVLLNVLPRAAIVPGDQSSMAVMGGPIDEVPSFFNVPADSSEARRYGPTVVGLGGAVLSGFAAGPIDSFPDLKAALDAVPPVDGP